RVLRNVDPALRADLESVERRRDRLETRRFAAEPGVEPAERELVDARADRGGTVEPRAHDELITARRRVARLHRPIDRQVGEGVLQAGVVERLAPLEDVRPATDQERGDSV